MKKLVLTVFIAAIAWSVSGQFAAENVDLKGNFDDDTLPTHFYGTYNDVWGYAAEGREYAILGSASYVQFMDVTDPTNIVEVDRVAPGAQTVWRDMKVFGNYCYSVADNSGEGLVIIDMSGLPESVEVVNTITDQFGSSHNIYIEAEKGRLYTAGAGQSGTFVYDLNTDPANPTYLGFASMSGRTLHDLYVKDNIAYGSSGNDGFYIWDLNNPNDQKLIAFTETNGYNHSSWLIGDGRYAIFAEEVPTGLPMGIMDLENMMDGDIIVDNYFKFPLLAPEQTGATPHNPYILGDFAFTSYYQDGLVVFDISDPRNVTRAGYFDTYPSNTDYPGYQGAWGCYPYLPSGNILISDMENGLFVLDFVGEISETEEFANIDFKVSPNPSSGYINVTADIDEDAVLSVFAANGSVVARQVLTLGAQNVSLDLASIPSGMYFVKLQSETGISIQKAEPAIIIAQ